MTDRRPHPVLLVPGWGQGHAELRILRARFVGSGWAETHVAAVSFADPRGSNHEHASEIMTHLEVLLGASGSSAVDVVAHSMGGLAVRRLLANDPSAPLRRVAFIATPHRGTLTAYFAHSDGAREMRPTSEFIRGIRAGPVTIPALAVRTAVDMHVIPGGSAILPEARNVQVWCGHRQLLKHRPTFEIVRDFFIRP